MTVRELPEKLPLGVSVLEDGNRLVEGVFCCDMLSVAMARAPEGSAWVTVVGNVNVVAVATLTEVACVVIAEGYSFDEDAINAAKGKITLLKSDMPTYETAASIGAFL